MIRRERTMMKLDKAIELSKSTNYKERLMGEFWETKIRSKKLHKIIVRYDTGTLDFKPKCSLELLKKQASTMGQYLYILEMIAVIEGIDLDCEQEEEKEIDD